MTTLEIDRLAILTISGSQSASLMQELSQEDFHFTVIDSSGGILRGSEMVLLVGFHSVRMPALLEAVRRYCTPYRQFIPAQGFPAGESSTAPMVEVQLGGAFIHVINVERFEQI